MIKNRITKNKIVSFNYSMKDVGGNMIYSNMGLMPLIYLHGYGNIISGLEESLEDMNINEEKKIKVMPQKAYGDIKKSLIVTESLKKIDKNNKFHKIGDSVQYILDGKICDMKIVNIKDELVILDGNHPLAGETLIYDVKIISISEASKIEIACGYPITDAINTCQMAKGCC